jgi:hypothetical protein
VAKVKVIVERRGIGFIVRSDEVAEVAEQIQ